MTTEPIAVRADPPVHLDLPPAHLELTWRPLHAGDAGQLHGLMTVVAEADGSPARMSRAMVDEIFAEPWRDMQRDSLGGFDGGGALRAFAIVAVRPGDVRTVRAFLQGGVHPAWRGRGIGRAVLAWLEGRGRQKLAESGKELPARLAVFVDEHARDNRRLYAAAGFSPIRWYTEMRRDLADPLPDVSVDGVRIEPWRPELDEAVRLAHNEAFADHWGSEPRAPEEWKHGPHFMPEWTFVALAGDEVVGYVLSGRYDDDFPVVGYSFGYSELLGVRRAWRGRGIAVALLADAMAAYRASGMAYAMLGVDTANPSGAHGLYERLGYRAVHGEVLYSVEI
ncbi:GNAT family N-acetyltransferase [Actinotalea fermentans]|uniref:Putative acetyltransferase, GNAT n=1 Tax=Actinotalea fermentans TaxID=43671 RepID=A0A511YU49_9CELL|nr:GNAT family N-acetyltransferase [Actinotalea fermentans]KGM17163.1 GCN5 family acetyltransferase [Actinotalea fermentans ATCC 43279 = JCM 9966 = DSM 3133]GEN78723.1 putative acetyltransferase, GNAT [Actinotalea fermentans]